VSDDQTETSAVPRRFQLKAAYAQIRVPNAHLRLGARTTAWRAAGFKRHAIITEDQIHPDDLEHLLKATFDVDRLETDQFGAKRIVREPQPMLVELPPG
jgi:hypothetical protein